MLAELFEPTLSATAQIVPPGLFDGVVTESYADLARSLVGFVVAAAVAYSLGRLAVIPLTVRVVVARNRNNPTIATATRTYAHAIIVAIAALVGIAGAGLWSLLTNLSIVVAALTLVVGAASQDVVGSLTSGLFLVSDPDFNVGDWIAWPGGEGVVEEIDFRVTRVRTPNNETIAVPNTELTANALTRPYGREHFRLVESFEISYEDDSELALRELVDVARNDDRVLEEPTPSATLAELGPGSVRVRAEFWIEEPMNLDMVTLRSDIRREVKARFDDVGLTLGPPATRELSGSLDVDVEAESTSEGRTKQ